MIYYLAWAAWLIVNGMVLTLLGRTTREPERRDEGGQQ